MSARTMKRAASRAATKQAKKAGKAAAKVGVVTPKAGGVAPKAGVTITPEKNQFADEFLDVIGNEFKFDHAKGLAEWMKNSADAYTTSTSAKESEHYILLRFKLGRPKKNSVFECIDFVGMTKENIDNAFKQWGSTSAAKRGKAVATFGGHGNGGKFYMRQMFRTAHFITYRNGRLNVFGFNEKKSYGYDAGARDLKMSLQDALAYAGLSALSIPKEVSARWKAKPNDAGFTVVRGEGPERFTGRSTIPSILERLRVHPQARRLLRHKPVYYLEEGKPWGSRLELPDIKPRDGFEAPREVPLPKSLMVDGEPFDLASLKGGKGKLTLRTSAVPLARSGELSAMNTIDVIGEVGCIGSYRMNELGGFLLNGPEAEFIYGEVDAAFLEEKEHNSVTNDREKLVRNELTDAFLDWVREQVDAFAGEMADKRNAEKRTMDLSLSAEFNRVLDKWKDKFMQKLSGQLFGGSGIGTSFGGSGGGGGGGAGAGGGEGGESGGDTGTKGGEEEGAGSGENGKGGGSGDTARPGPTFPRVLLSGYDQDPLSESGNPLQCDERHPPVYQRPMIDTEAGIYWINTSRPFATRLLALGANNVRWREYLFQRYCDIILKQSVYNLAKHDPTLTPDAVDQLIDVVIARVHDAANEQLQTFLFEEKVAVASSQASDADEGREEEAEEAEVAA